MLAHLYHDLHQVVYLGAASLSVEVTLLQIWAWEHITVTQPIAERDRLFGRPYVFEYLGGVFHHKLGKLEYWW